MPNTIKKIERTIKKQGKQKYLMYALIGIFTSMFNSINFVFFFCYNFSVIFDILAFLCYL